MNLRILEWTVVVIQKSAIDKEIIMKLTVKQNCSYFEM
jgi:hypothetical protein